MSTRARLSVAIVLACVIGAICASDAAAQTPERIEQKVWVTTTDGTELKGTMTSFTSANVLLRTRDGRSSTIPLRDVQRIEVPDGLGNGARNGAVTGGLVLGVPFLLLLASECGGDCSGITPFVVSGTLQSIALGAGIGVFVDAVRVRRHTIYGAAHSATSLTVAPMVGPKTAGVRVSIAWPHR